MTCLYIGLKKETQGQSGSSSLMMVCSLQLLLVTVQMLSVMRRFDINWREPFASVLVYLEFLSFDLEMLSVSCVTTMSPVAIFGVRSLVIPVMMFAILVVHLCFLLCTRSKTFQGNNLWRTMGTTFLVFFIILFSMLLAPFQCYGHPNGTSTLKRYATVYCDGEGQHLEMFIIGGFLALLIQSSTCSQLLHPFWESLGNMSLSAAYFQVFVGRFCVLDARAVLGDLYMGGAGAASRPLGQVSLRRTSSPTKIWVERLPGFWFMVPSGKLTKNYGKSPCY